MDITKCKADGCVIKNHCKRFTSESSQYQSWFFEPPFTKQGGVFTCDMFWGVAQDGIINQLEQIITTQKQQK